MTLSLLARTRGILERYNLKPRKGLSQRFLIDEQVFLRLIEAAQIAPDDRILEIGAGLGFLTEALGQKANQVIALEIDAHLCGILLERFKSNEKIQTVCEDVLKFNPNKWFGNQKRKVIGNLPYHISGSILRWLLDHRTSFSEIYLTVQKEVAERIVAKPRSKAYGVLSILCQYFTAPEILFIVPNEAFFPPPKVESAFLKLIPQPDDWSPNHYVVPLVKQAFSQRRKTLLNNVKSWKLENKTEWETLFAGVGITGKERAEELPLETFVKISELLERRIGG